MVFDLNHEENDQRKQRVVHNMFPCICHLFRILCTLLRVIGTIITGSHYEVQREVVVEEEETSMDNSHDDDDDDC